VLTKADLLRRIRAEAEATRGLTAAYLFGSFVRGQERARDIDLALLWHDGVSPGERHLRGEALARSLEAATGDHWPVDLVDLAAAPPALQHRVLSEGLRAFERDPVARVRFEASTISKALDFIEWQRPYLDRWLESVALGR